MKEKRAKIIIIVLFAFIMILIVYFCSSTSTIDTIDGLTRLDDVISFEAKEVDIEYLARLDEYFDNFRLEYDEFVEYQHGDLTLIPPEEILYFNIRYRCDEAEVIGHISAPKDYLTNDYPILIYNRGGNGSYGQLEDPETQYYAQIGFIVLATQYRGVDDGTGVDEFGGADVADVIKLIDFSEMFTFTNRKIYMFGWSRGAMQTYIVLSRDSRIDAAVAGAGPTNLFMSYDESDAALQRVFRLRVGLPGTDTEKFKERSAMYWPEKIDTPLFIAHGTADERVMFHHSQDLFDAMNKLGKNVKLTLYPDMDHGDPAWAFVADYFYWLKQH